MEVYYILESAMPYYTKHYVFFQRKLYQTLPMYLLYRTVLNYMGTRLCHPILRYLYSSAFLPQTNPIVHHKSLCCPRSWFRVLEIKRGAHALL